jgi:hypothetical protein
MPEFHGLLTGWLQILAAKGVQELLLVNGRWPHVLVLPSTFLRMATLTRLYLGLWKFPDTAGFNNNFPRAASFPNLRELGLCSVVMDCRHMDFILAGSPVLEILCLQGNFSMDRLTLVARSSLRCVQTSMVSDLEISVEDAPHLGASHRLVRSVNDPEISAQEDQHWRCPSANHTWLLGPGSAHSAGRQHHHQGLTLTLSLPSFVK